MEALQRPTQNPPHMHLDNMQRKAKCAESRLASEVCMGSSWLAARDVSPARSSPSNTHPINTSHSGLVSTLIALLFASAALSF